MGETTMEWEGIDIVKKLLKEKHIVVRERTPIETIFYAVFLYLGGLSLKGVKTRLLSITRSRTAIRTWVQKLGGLIKEKIADELPEVVIADETPFQVKDMNLWFWYVIDPKTRKLIYFKITWNRTNHACKKTLFRDKSYLRKETKTRHHRWRTMVLYPPPTWYLS
ncbi:MAG: hypothetical protein QXX20_06035 [Candidatus Thermoplasmatota archaeon]